MIVHGSAYKWTCRRKLRVMKATLFLSFLAAVFLSALADDITFTNKTASFTNLQGQLFKGVQLVRGDLDGLIWRDGASGAIS